MSKPRFEIARQVRRSLRTGERSNEQSLADSARFLSDLAGAGLRIDAALEVTQEVFEDAFASIASGMESRRRYLAAHRRLVDIAKLIGADITAEGGGGSKKPQDFVKGEAATVVEFGRAA